MAEPLVRACSVVLANVLADDALEVPVIKDQEVIEALATHGAEKRSQMAFMSGARTAMRSMPMPVARRHQRAVPNLLWSQIIPSSCRNALFARRRGL